MVVGQAAQRLVRNGAAVRGCILLHQPEGIDQFDRIAADQHDARDQPRRRRWLNRIGQPDDVDDFGDRITEDRLTVVEAQQF